MEQKRQTARRARRSWTRALLVSFWGLSCAAAAVAADGPQVRLHLSFDDTQWVRHAAGRDDVLCLSPELVPGRVANYRMLALMESTRRPQTG